MVYFYNIFLWGGFMLFGFNDLSTTLSFVLSIAATILCTIYGIVKWNSEGYVSEKEITEETNWAKEEMEIEKELSDRGDL